MRVVHQAGRFPVDDPHDARCRPWLRESGHGGTSHLPATRPPENVPPGVQQTPASVETPYMPCGEERGDDADQQAENLGRGGHMTHVVETGPWKTD
jgi:hypothetical protein